MQSNNYDAYLEVQRTIKKWLYIIDDGLIKIVLATVVANLLPDDPLWLLIVSASGGAKTEMLRGLDSLEYIHMVSDLTPQALLSGMQKQDAGLLDRIGDFGILIMKDFTTVLQMNKDKRHDIMARLREIYDGVVSKGFGNGKTAVWSGKIGFLGAVTSVVDQHSTVYQTLGERFIQYRPVQPKPADVARRAMENAGYEKQMRSEITAVIVKFFAAIDLPKEPMKVPEPYKEKIIHLATFCAVARSGVIREGYSQEIALVPEPELPTRLAKQLNLLFCSLATISGDFTETDYRLVYKVALDNLTSVRRKLIQFLITADGPVSLANIVTELHLPANTLRRRLEDLVALQIIKADDAGTNGLPIFYELAGDIAEHIEAAKPDNQTLRDNISTIFFAGRGIPEMSEG